jgi:hypothetical protein
MDFSNTIDLANTAALLQAQQSINHHGEVRQADTRLPSEPAGDLQVALSIGIAVFFVAVFFLLALKR